MKKENIDQELKETVFDFFYLFSRFEFALKENGYLNSHETGANAEPGWDEFTTKKQVNYKPSEEASLLLKAPPKRQKVDESDRLIWKLIGLDDCKSDLARVVRLLKTVRNNLFHGGKHDSGGWDNPVRTRFLLTNGIAVLIQLAELAEIQSDFEGVY